MHLDGARLMNACVASGLAPIDYAKYFDTVSICFSKGLGAPVGSAVAGSKDVITRAHRFRKMFGGAMRQSGFLAAAAVYALDHHIEGLEVDLVLVMSVVPGFGGQSFMEEVLSKTRWLRDQGYPGHIEMDGGLNAETLPECARAGADALVAGSAIFGADDMGATIERFRTMGREAQEPGSGGRAEP